MGGIANGACASHDIVERGILQVGQEALSEGKRRLKIVARKLAQQRQHLSGEYGRMSFASAGRTPESELESASTRSC
jgi:hypothetical protein